MSLQKTSRTKKRCERNAGGDIRAWHGPQTGVGDVTGTWDACSRNNSGSADDTLHGTSASRWLPGRRDNVHSMARTPSGMTF